MKPKLAELPNGLKVLLLPHPDTQALTLLVLCKVGSRYEPPAASGLSHFIEHLMFKGTKRRPSTLDISKALDSVGAEYNAFTAKDRTGYYIKVSKNKLSLALDVLSDILFNSKFDPAEIDRERGVILEEINMYEDNPLMYCEDILEELAFRPTHPLGQLIIGPRQNIRTVSPRQILKYRDQFYAPGNMVLALAGNFNSRALKLIKKYFFQTPLRPKKIEFKKFKLNQKQPQIKILYKKTAQVQTCLSLPAYPYGHQNLSALNVLSVILGGNMSSRLFTEIRERRGLAYYIKSDLNIYQDTGLFVIQAGLDKNRLAHALQEILKQLKEVKTAGVTADEVKKAKDYLKGKIDLNLEDSEEQASWYASQYLLTHRLETPEQKMKKINQVTARQIQQVARELFKTKYLNLALIGPFKDQNKFKKIILNCKF